MEQGVDAARDGLRDLIESTQASDAIDRAPGRRAAAKDLRLEGAVWLTCLDTVVEEVPISDRRLLEARVV